MSVSLRFVLASLLFVSLFAHACAENADEVDQAVVTIDSPEAGSFVNESRVRIRGTASGTSRVMVNGNAAEVVGGKWDVLVDFEEGPATATASAGEAEDAVEFFVDTVAPTIELSSPERGRFVEEGESKEIVFAGSAVDDGSGLKVLALDDTPVSYGEDGSFSHAVELGRGYNEFKLRAVDEAGNVASVMRAALHGPMVDPTAEIDSAAEIEISPEAFATAAEVIESLLTAERMTGFVQESLADNDNIAVDLIDFDSLSVDMIPTSAGPSRERGYLAVTFHVTNFQVEGTATISGEDYPVTITVDEATIATEVTLAATDTGDLDVSLDHSELIFEEEDLHFSFDGYSEDDLSDSERDMMRGIAVSAAQAAFADLLSDELFDELYTPGMLRRQVEILGRTFEFRLVLQQVRTTSDYVHVRAALAIVSERYEGVPQAPGALELPLGQGAAPEIAGDILFSTHRTAIDRILHGVWRGGLLNLELRGADFEGMELPVELRADALGALLDDRIAQLDSPSTPAGMRLRPLLPPVAALGQQAEDSEAAGDEIGLRLGELLVDLRLLPADGEPIEVVTVALFLDLKASFEIEDGKLGLGIEARARADVDTEHEIDLDDEELEELLANLSALASEMIGDEMELTAAAELDWLTIDNLQAEIHGNDDDRLSVTADVQANPDAVE